MHMHRVAWLVTAGLFAFPSEANSLQLNPSVTPTVETAEKGKTFQINVTLEADEPLDSLEIVLLPPENFCAQAVSMLPSAGFSIAADGSARLSSLPGGSRTTVQFFITTPTENRFARNTCNRSESSDSTGVTMRSADNTRDPRTFVFNGRYRTVEDSAWHLWTSAVKVNYTTSRAVFLGMGILGVVLGYIVKSLTARKTEAIQATKAGTKKSEKFFDLLAYVFGTSIDKLLTSLVLGFAALLTIQKTGIPVGGYASALLAGITIGVLADDALISKLK